MKTKLKKRRMTGYPLPSGDVKPYGKIADALMEKAKKGAKKGAENAVKKAEKTIWENESTSVVVSGGVPSTRNERALMKDPAGDPSGKAAGVYVQVKVKF